jgi:uncharacterized membrane protein YgcG
MRTSIVKMLLALALVLSLLAPAAALGDARFPADAGVLTDDANVIGQTMAGDIAAYAQQVEDETGVRLHVALVLFWDGETAQDYADTLFTRWEFGADDLLLAGAVAEDTFAVASGENVKAKLSDSSLNSLLYSSGFADRFRQQQYDAAFGTFFVAFHSLLGRQYGLSSSLDSLFAAYQPAATATEAPQSDASSNSDNSDYSNWGTYANFPNELWNETMATIGDSIQRFQSHSQSETSGLTPGAWVVLVVILVILVGQRRRTRRGGCGCSPVGWVLGGLGLGALLNRDDDPSCGRGCRHSRRR